MSNGRVRESKQQIESMLQKKCDLFAYPDGRFTPSVGQTLANEGYRLAFTAVSGAWNGGNASPAIPRQERLRRRM